MNDDDDDDRKMYSWINVYYLSIYPQSLITYVQWTKSETFEIKNLLQSMVQNVGN